MPRKYKKKLGSRPYKNYTKETLCNALTEIRNQTLSMRRAADKYGIPVATLSNKCNDKHSKKYGGQLALLDKEEADLKTVLKTLSVWRSPLSLMEIRMLIKTMLDKAGKANPMFKNNMPGDDWVRSFLSRHTELTQRITQNIKLARAEVSEETINQYFDNLEESLQGVPPSNIWNYDETNFTDEPGRKKAVVKRGMKYPERAMNASKASISVMFCGNGIGTVLPPYVVYKSEHLWERWCQGGPSGSRFNRTKSGWFDSHSFQDWFKSTFLPAAKRQSGLKIIIGDNLSSHLDLSIIKICEKENIRFVFLPPNTTHLTQPLDVAFYRPLKRAWRSILSEWKEKTKVATALPKDEFPKHLRELEERINPRQANNLISGFRACGIIPIDRSMVLRKLPTTSTEAISNQVLNDSVLELLRERNAPSTSRRKKRSRVNVEPGRSVCTDDFPESVSDSSKEETAEPSHEEEPESESSAGDLEEETGTIASSSGSRETNFTGVYVVSEDAIRAGHWLLVNFASETFRIKAYIGQVQTITCTARRNKEFEACFLRSKSQRICDKNLFVYPEEMEICEFTFDKVIGRVENPEILRRGVLKFAIDSHKW